VVLLESMQQAVDSTGAARVKVASDDFITQHSQSEGIQFLVAMSLGWYIWHVLDEGMARQSCMWHTY